MDKSKTLVAVDIFGNYTYYSVEEVLAKKLNHWRDWDCSAGVNSIHVTADGNLYKAVCKNDGFLGNVFDSGVIYPEFWTKCKFDRCMCGADMQLEKSQSGQYEKVDLVKEVKDLVFFDKIELSPFYKKGMPDKMITWDIGRRCNLKCSYCPPSTSNNYESHKSFESLKLAADNLILGFCKGKKGRWIFTGGEPTVNPHFLPLVKYLKNDFGHSVFTQTNGTRTKEYLAELLEHSSIGISLHLEEIEVDRFVETVKFLSSLLTNNETYKNRKLSIRIMVGPGHFKVAKYVFDMLNGLETRDSFSLHMSPLYEKLDFQKMMDYHVDELRNIIAHA